MHVKRSEQERVQQLMSMSMPEQLAKLIAFLEVSSVKGAEERMNHVVEKVTGRSPQNFDAWVEENKAAWQ